MGKKIWVCNAQDDNVRVFGDEPDAVDGWAWGSLEWDSSNGYILVCTAMFKDVFPNINLPKDEELLELKVSAELVEVWEMEEDEDGE